MLFWAILMITVCVASSTRRCILDQPNVPQPQSVRGQLRNSTQYKGVVKIYHGSGRRKRTCFGVDIGGQRFLTVAHCLFGRPNVARGSSSLMEKPALSTHITVQEDSQAVTFSSYRVHHHPHYKFHRQSRLYRYDLAILHPMVNQSLKDISCDASKQCPSLNETCYLLSRGRYINVQLSLCEKYLRRHYSRCNFQREIMCIHMNHTIHETIHKGDSGSPLFCQRKNETKYYIAGLLSGKIRDTNYLTITRINEYVLRMLQRKVSYVWRQQNSD